MSSYVLDASAVLVLLFDEPGAADVARAVPDAVISAVNLAEVVGKLSDAQMSAAQIQAALDRLDMEVVPFDELQAYRAGVLIRKTKRAGLSLGDRACLALAADRGLTALTTDSAWKRVRCGARVRVIGRG